MAAVSVASYAILGMQAAMLLTMLYGVHLARARRRMRRHGAVMTGLAVLNVATVAAVMAPTFYGLDPAPGPSSPSIILVHHYLGLMALAITAVVAFPWALRGANEGNCPGAGRRGRLIMRATFAIWVASLLLGIGAFFSL
mgnify:FL=1